MAGRSIRYLIIDLDGVLRRNRQPLPGAAELLRWLERRGIGYTIVSNNAVPTPSQLAAALAEMGILVDERRLITSAAGAAWFLSREWPGGARVYIIGEEGLRQAILADGLFVEDERRPDCVVVGADRAINYRKLAIACRALCNGARFVATNTDPRFPTEDGVAPGAGALVAAVETCSGVKPTVVGKPQVLLLRMALERMGAQPEETALVGDQLETDVAGGMAAGLRTILVLTGLTAPADLAASPIKPACVFRGLPELMEAWHTL